MFYLQLDVRCVMYCTCDVIETLAESTRKKLEKISAPDYLFYIIINYYQSIIEKDIIILSFPFSQIHASNGINYIHLSSLLKHATSWNKNLCSKRA